MIKENIVPIIGITSTLIVITWGLWMLGFLGGRIEQEIGYDNVRTHVCYRGYLIKSWYDNERDFPISKIDSVAKARLSQGEDVLRVMKERK